MTKPFDPTKPVQTRDGRRVRIIATDAAGAWPIVALLEQESGHEVALHYASNGFHGGSSCNSDLINTPVKHRREWWVNVYPSYVSSSKDTKEDANRNADPDRIACLHIVREFEEGEGL